MGRTFALATCLAFLVLRLFSLSTEGPEDGFASSDSEDLAYFDNLSPVFLGLAAGMGVLDRLADAACLTS